MVPFMAQHSRNGASGHRIGVHYQQTGLTPRGGGRLDHRYSSPFASLIHAHSSPDASIHKAVPALFSGVSYLAMSPATNGVGQNGACRINAAFAEVLCGYAARTMLYFLIRWVLARPAETHVLSATMVR